MPMRTQLKMNPDMVGEVATGNGAMDTAEMRLAQEEFHGNRPLARVGVTSASAQAP